jgi:hypothetical protein
MPSRAATKTMDRGILYIIGGVVAVLVIVVGVEVGVESKPTTGINLSLNTSTVPEQTQ